MMIKKIFTVVLIFATLLSSTLISIARNEEKQENCLVIAEIPGIQWVKHFGRPDHTDDAKKVRQTSDGGYILVGETQSYTTDGEFDAWLIKTDKNGVEEWNRTYGEVGFTNWTDGLSVEQTQDGGYFVVGLRTILDEDAHAWVVKTTADGTEQWNKVYNSSFRGECVQQTTDEGYIIAGASYLMDAWLCRLDENGDVLWEQTFYEADSASINSLQQTLDGGFILAGRLYYQQNDNETGFLIKTDANGHEQWNKTYGWPAPSGGFYSIHLLPDGYIASGLICVNNLYDQAWLIRMDMAGNISWSRTFSFGTDSACGALEVDCTFDGGFIITGDVETTSTSGWILKTDAEGNLEWQINPIEKYDQSFSSVQETSDGSIIVTGVSADDANGNVVLLKIGHVPQVTITKPVNALYFLDKERCKLRFPFIIGPITIEADVNDTEYSITRVEFFIDDILQSVDYSAPYSWRWQKPTLFFHTIQVTAVNEAENSSSDTLTVFKML